MSEANEGPSAELLLQLPPILLRPPEAARILAISERTLWDLTAAGEIRAVNIGQGKERTARRYLVEDLLAWARARRDENETTAD